MIGDGILALWNDCEASHEDAYEDWYQGEHLAERLAVPGFRRGRRMQPSQNITSADTCRSSRNG